MSRAPRFTVLLPTHNRADVIGFAIQSVLDQTEQNFELLIVGDGCTDNTKQVVASYLSDPRVSWFDFPKTTGFGYANRNLALKTAKGIYLAFMAHDDLWFSDHLERLGALLDSSDELDIVCSRPLWVEREGRILPSTFNLDNERLLDIFLNHANAIPATCFVYRSSAVNKTRVWNEKLKKEADWDLYKRIINAKKRINYAWDQIPTTFHFLADWRQPDKTSPHVQLANIAEQHNLFPANLMIPVATKKTEQETVATLLKKPNWASQVRKASMGLLDVMHFFVTPRIEEIDRQHQIILALQQEQRANQAEIKEFKNSRTYKTRQKLGKLIPKKRK